MATAAARSVFRSAAVNNAAAARLGAGPKAARSSFCAPTSRISLSCRIFRCPAEMSACMSLHPFHTATASALMTSMLSLSRRDYGWLPEGI